MCFNCNITYSDCRGGFESKSRLQKRIQKLQPNSFYNYGDNSGMNQENNAYQFDRSNTSNICIPRNHSNSSTYYHCVTPSNAKYNYNGNHTSGHSINMNINVNNNMAINMINHCNYNQQSVNVNRNLKSTMENDVLEMIAGHYQTVKLLQKFRLHNFDHN